MALARPRVITMAKSGLSLKLLLPSNSRRLTYANLSDSNHLFHKFLKEPSSSLKSLLDSQLQAQQQDPALTRSQLSWKTLFASLRSSSFTIKAQIVLEWRLDKMMNENEPDQDRYSELISLCAELQNLPLAMKVFTSMEAQGIKPTSPVFNSLIQASLSANNVITAFSLFEIMQSSETYKPTSHTYSAFISAFSHSGNFESMEAWNSAKIASGFSFDLQTYESLIHGSVKSNNFDIAYKYYLEMMESGFRPSSVILENVFEGVCRKRSFDQAKEFFKSAMNIGWEINANMAERFIRLCFESGKVEEAEGLLAELNESNLISIPGFLAQIHCEIIRMYAMSDRLDDVEYSVGRMLKQGLSFECFSSSDDDAVEKIICSYFRCEAYDRLDLFLEHIKGSCALRKSTYDLLIAGYRRAGLWDKLDLVIKNMGLQRLS